MVDRGDQGELDRRQRIRSQRDARDQREDERVDVLHQEQVRRALDVGDDAPSFGNDVGQMGELAVEQYELRDSAGGR